MGASTGPELWQCVQAATPCERHQIATMDSLPSIKEMPTFDYDSDDVAMPFSGGSNV